MDPRLTPERAHALVQRLDPISPELVLVDPALRSRLLREQAELRATPSLRPSPDWSEPDPGPLVSLEVARSFTRHWGRIQLVVAACCGGAVVLATGQSGTSPSAGALPTPSMLEAHAGVSTSERPPPIISLTVRKHSKHTPTPVLTRPPAKAASAPTLRRFVWAPVAGTSGYAVALYRGGTRVYQKRTRLPSIDIPVRSSSRSSSGVEPGSYEWYVWPIHSGVTDPVAVVRSKLVLSAS